MMHVLMTLVMMMTFQVHLNDCGPASVLMVAKYYHLDLPHQDPGDLHYEETGGTDRALHITEVVWMLRDLGIETEYTYSHSDIQGALVEGEYPMIYLLEDRAHFVVLWRGYILDPREGIKRVAWQEFLDHYETGVGLLIENLGDLDHQDPYEKLHLEREER